VLAISIAAAGHSPALAQTTTSVLTVNLRTKGLAPRTVTSYMVTTTCGPLQNDLPSLSVASTYTAFGGSYGQIFGLTALTKCSVKVTAAGAGAAVALVVVSVAGVPISTGTLGVTQTFDSATAGTFPATGPLTIDVSINYPSLTVVKTVVGTELFPGAAYGIGVGCLYGDGVSAGGTTFSLKSGASKTVTTADIPGLSSGASCYVVETDSAGGSTAYSSTNADGTKSPGIALPNQGLTDNPLTAAGLCISKSAAGGCTSVYGFSSAPAKADGQTVTVTNSFVGDLLVSKVVTGEPKSNIAIYELNVLCKRNEVTTSDTTFLLKDRQSKLFENLFSGTVCVVTERRSDGAVATFSDNSGDNAADGKVVIKGTTVTCSDPRFPNYADCRANVVVTNSYTTNTSTDAGTTTTSIGQPSTTQANLVAVATTVAPIAPTTAAPVATALVEEAAVLDDTEVVLG
jgi:Domain of unknown function (DUF5979)